MGELAELRPMMRRQGEMISSLTDCVTRLEQWRRVSRRGLGDSSGSSLDHSIYGSAWSSSGTRDSPIVECQVCHEHAPSGVQTCMRVQRVEG